MAKIGRIPLAIPQGVAVELKDATIAVRGTKGEQSIALPSPLTVTVADDSIRVSAKNNDRETLSLQGLTRNLIRNGLIGVSEGFSRRLEMKGTGYRAEIKENALSLVVGFSHPVNLPIPEGIKVSVERNTIILLEGPDRQSVGQFAANIRSVRPPEPYKGKGIKYAEEVIARKPGKAAKATGATA